MAKADLGDERMRLLRSLRRRRFERFRYRGADALVAQIPEGVPLPAAVRESLAKRSEVRIYPVLGGFIYKWPHYIGGQPPEGFAVEADGWDHQHCDACSRTINVGKTAWLTVRGSSVQICPYCYRRVAQPAFIKPAKQLPDR